MLKIYTTFSPSPLSAWSTTSSTASPLVKVVRRSPLHLRHANHHQKNSACANALPQRATYLTTPPPSTPLNWLWQCHICRRTYTLSVTRRCLDDGHYFCSGFSPSSASGVRTSSRSRRAKKPHRACASEFDYAGWKRWGEWRRGEMAARKAANMDNAKLLRTKQLAIKTPTSVHRDCETNCDYPSDCRWGGKFGVSPTTPACSVSATPPATSFEEILGLEVALSDTDAVAKEDDKNELNDFFETLIGVPKKKVAGSEVERVRSVFEDDDDEEEADEEDRYFSMEEDGDETF